MLAAAATARLVIALVNARNVASPVETFPYVLVLGVLLVVATFAGFAASVGRGLPQLRSLYPDALAAPVVVRADGVDDFRALTGVRFREGRSVGLDATFEQSLVRFWRGRRPRLIGQMPADSLTFAVGEITTPAGSFPALLMTVASHNMVRTFRLVPMSTQGRWFPKQLNRAQTQSLVDQLNEHAGTRRA
jgi:hypothetical protein